MPISKARTKSEQEVADEREFARRQYMPYVEKRYLRAGGRVFDVLLTIYGVTVGQKTETTSRGRVSSVSYFLPSLDSPEIARVIETTRLPVARSNHAGKHRYRSPMHVSERWVVETPMREPTLYSEEQIQRLRTEGHITPDGWVRIYTNKTRQGAESSAQEWRRMTGQTARVAPGPGHPRRIA